MHYMSVLSLRKDHFPACGCLEMDSCGEMLTWLARPYYPDHEEGWGESLGLSGHRVTSFCVNNISFQTNTVNFLRRRSRDGVLLK